MKLLAITEHLKISMTGGKPLIHSSYGYNPSQIEAEVKQWQDKQPDHPRFSETLLWLKTYQPKIDAYSKRLAEIGQLNATQDYLQINTKKDTEKEIERAVKRGHPREIAEKRYAALFFLRFLEVFEVFGCSHEETHNRLIDVGRDLFKDHGYSDNEADKRTIVALEVAEKLRAGT